MKKISTLVLFTLLLTLKINAQSKDEKQLTAAVQTLRKGMLDGDRQILNDITASELTYGHSSGKLEDKAQFVEALATGKSDFVTLDLTEQTIRLAGKTAIVRHNLDAITKDNGVDGTAKLGVLLVWQKQHGKWKLLARQAFKR